MLTWASAIISPTWPWFWWAAPKYSVSVFARWMSRNGYPLLRGSRESVQCSIPLSHRITTGFRKTLWGLGLVPDDTWHRYKGRAILLAPTSTWATWTRYKPSLQYPIVFAMPVSMSVAIIQATWFSFLPNVSLIVFCSGSVFGHRKELDIFSRCRRQLNIEPGLLLHREDGVKVRFIWIARRRRAHCHEGRHNKISFGLLNRLNESKR